jgi:hypothetical protein
MFMAAGNEGIGFVVGYHVEELGEDVGVILLIGAAVAMTRLSLSRDGGLSLTYVEQPARLDQRRSDAGIPGPIPAGTGG